MKGVVGRLPLTVGTKASGGRSNVHTLGGVIEAHVRAHGRIDPESRRNSVDQHGRQLWWPQPQRREVLCTHEQCAGGITAHEQRRSCFLAVEPQLDDLFLAWRIVRRCIAARRRP